MADVMVVATDKRPRDECDTVGEEERARKRLCTDLTPLAVLALPVVPVVIPPFTHRLGRPVTYMPSSIPPPLKCDLVLRRTQELGHAASTATLKADLDAFKRDYLGKLKQVLALGNDVRPSEKDRLRAFLADIEIPNTVPSWPTDHRVLLENIKRILSRYDVDESHTLPFKKTIDGFKCIYLDKVRYLLTLDDVRPSHLESLRALMVKIEANAFAPWCLSVLKTHLICIKGILDQYADEKKDVAVDVDESNTPLFKATYESFKQHHVGKLQQVLALGDDIRPSHREPLRSLMLKLETGTFAPCRTTVALRRLLTDTRRILDTYHTDASHTAAFKAVLKDFKCAYLNRIRQIVALDDVRPSHREELRAFLEKFGSDVVAPCTFPGLDNTLGKVRRIIEAHFM